MSKADNIVIGEDGATRLVMSRERAERIAHKAGIVTLDPFNQTWACEGMRADYSKLRDPAICTPGIVGLWSVYARAAAVQFCRRYKRDAKRRRRPVRRGCKR